MDARAGAGGTQRAWVRAKRFYLLSVLMYALLATVFVAMAWAQQRQSSLPIPSQTYLVPPTGSDDVAVQRYFDYLKLQAAGNLTETYHQNWQGLTEALGFGAAFLIATYFFVFAWFARRRTGDLYPVEVYNGYITERNGGVDPFNWAVYALVAIYAIAYVALSLRFGQIY